MKIAVGVRDWACGVEVEIQPLDGGKSEGSAISKSGVQDRSRTGGDTHSIGRTAALWSDAEARAGVISRWYSCK